MTVTINGTTGIAGTNGSAGTPAVQGEDTNTGIFFPAADTVAVATAGTERLRVDSSGNVLIGTATSVSNNRLVIDQASGDGANSGFLVQRNGAAGTSFKIDIDSSDVANFRRGVTNAMSIDSSGKVGIGSTAPSAKLMSQVSTFTDADKVALKAYNAQSVGAYASFQNSATGTAFTDGFRIGIDDSENAVLQNLEATNMLFATSGTERARINSSGALLVGTTTDNPHATGTFGSQISVGGAVIGVNNSHAIIAARWNGNGEVIRLQRDNSDVGSIDVTTTATSYNTSSDYRLKENVAPMQNALDTVAQLNPVTYTWKADGSAGQGFIAHELQAVVPDCVTGEKDAVDAEGNPQYQGVDTSFLVATLVKAIQELTARIAILEAK